MKMNMKRKDQVTDDFSEFSLSSPPSKIRRLDHTAPHTPVLPPIIQEEEDHGFKSHPQPPPPCYNYCGNRHPAGSSSVVIEELPSDFYFDSDSDFDTPPLRDDPVQNRSLVLFKPVPTPPRCSPSSFSLISVDSHILSQIKNNRFPWSSKLGSCQEIDNSNNNGECLAVIPWMPQPSATTVVSPASATAAPPQSMETDEMDVEFQEEIVNAMDTATIAEEQVGTGMATANEASPSPGLFPQWQQQHCMIPQIPPSSGTPIAWSK